MYKTLLLTLALMGFALTTSGLTAGSLTGDPDNNKWKITTVQWIKGTKNQLKDDDRYAVLIGKVTKKIDGDTYLFNDGTGTIELDSDIDLPVDSNIVVRGHIDQAWLGFGISDYDNVELEVKSWRHVRRK
ncbi:MAG: NirD/YgiW/YdeI family stress tolerance protein [Verrucomicrobiae bacterium]|nr:NirD/YgiW/YdeI family stress tolerance protein [Verrucomicrobiae bacterium]